MRIAEKSERQRQQQALSWWRMFGVGINSPFGGAVWQRFVAALMILWSSAMAYIAAEDVAGKRWAPLLQEQAQTIHDISSRNTCLGLALLAKAYPDRWPLPPDCSAAIQQVHDATHH